MHVVSCLRYEDAPAAITWLKEVIGFEEQLVVAGPEGTIAHAELRLGTGMIMLGTARRDENPYDAWIRVPRELGGLGTQSVYVVVPDADLVYARAMARNAKILIEIQNQPYGGRDFTCQDPEGHLWSVGTYNPFAPDVASP